MIPDPEKRSIRIPIRWTGKEWALENGKPLPKLRANASGALVIPVSQLEELADRDWWTRERCVELLDEGATVFARVQEKNVPQDRLEQTLVKPHNAGGEIVFVEIVLSQPLQFKYSEGSGGKLVACLCQIPAPNDTAESLNEAYSKVAGEFEPERRSTTGNVFSKIFIEEKGCCVELETLRQRRLEERVADSE